MAIPIIGESTAESKPLPEPSVELPSIESAPECAPVHDEASLATMLKSEHMPVRRFAVEWMGSRIVRMDMEPLLPLLDDEDEEIAAAIAHLFAQAGRKDIIGKLSERFKTADNTLAVSCADALLELGSDALPDLVKTRGRMSELAYIGVVGVLARAPSGTATEFLSKALDRAAALSEPRRLGLYVAALTSGEDELAGRVIGLAASESRSASEEQAPIARIATARYLELPPAAASPEAAPQLLEALARVQFDAFDETIDGAFRDAVRREDYVGGITALQPLVELEVKHADGQRIQGILGAMLKRSRLLGALDKAALPLFAYLAYDLAGVISTLRSEEEQSPGLTALTKVLETEASSLSEEFLKTSFESLSPRTLRPVLLAVSTQRFHEEDVYKRVVHTLVDAGHAGALIEAAGDGQSQVLAKTLSEVLGEKPDAAEKAILGFINARPLEPKAIPVALMLAARLGTQRIALAIAHRFFDIRRIARNQLNATANILCAPVLKPLIESRAFRDEPEARIQALTELVAGEDLDERRKGILYETAEAAAKLALPLVCGACEERLTYRFEGVYIDPQATDAQYDPAFIGDADCKACGENALKPTEDATTIMAQDMMEYMARAQAGIQGPNPRVIPRRVMVGGENVSVAQALRDADDSVKESPDSVRARIRRARVRLLLERPNAQEDADAALAQVPDAPEALYARAAVRARQGDIEGSMADLVETHRLLVGEEEPRLFEEDQQAMLGQTEMSLLHLEELGMKLPEGIDLSNAREAVEAARQQQQEQEQEAHGHDHDHDHAGGAADDEPSRNSACPCGSGKKFKRCCGAR